MSFAADFSCGIELAGESYGSLRVETDGKSEVPFISVSMQSEEPFNSVSMDVNATLGHLARPSSPRSCDGRSMSSMSRTSIASRRHRRGR